MAAEVLDLAPAAGPVLAPFTRFEDLAFTTYRAVWMPRAVHGRIAFIGDAAHASSPLLGHGINLAMCDAVALATAVRSAGNVTDALDTYNRRQWPRNGYYSALSFVLNPSFQGRSPLLGVARDVVLPRMQRVPPIRSIMLRTLAGVWD